MIMKNTILLVILTCFTYMAQAQSELPPHIKNKMVYPAIDVHPWVGVIPHENVALGYDPSIDYKIIFDVVASAKDSSKMNIGLRETARTYNLHIANGVPEEKLNIAIIIHGGSVEAVLNNTAYKEIYGIDNPNTALIDALGEHNVQFYICSQSMAMHQIPAEDLNKNIQIALSAKTAITTLELKGYSYLEFSNH